MMFQEGSHLSPAEETQSKTVHPTGPRTSPGTEQPRATGHGREDGQIMRTGGELEEPSDPILPEPHVAKHCPTTPLGDHPTTTTTSQGCRQHTEIRSKCMPVC